MVLFLYFILIVKVAQDLALYGDLPRSLVDLIIP